MLPQTHFLGGIAAAFLLRSVVPIGTDDIMLAAMLSVAYDADHLYAYYRRHGELTMAHVWNASVRHAENDRTLLHHAGGLLLITPLALLLSFFSLKYGLILMTTYCLHMLMDHVHYRFNFSLKEKGILLPVSYEEIAIDAALVGVLAGAFYTA